jgi:hypothetical protein
MNHPPIQFKSIPFSFTEIMNAKPVTLINPQYLKASDGINLAYYQFCPEKRPIASIIFIHGAGAHCYLPHYQPIGYELKNKYNIETY